MAGFLGNFSGFCHVIYRYRATDHQGERLVTNRSGSVFLFGTVISGHYGHSRSCAVATACSQRTFGKLGNRLRYHGQHAWMASGNSFFRSSSSNYSGRKVYIRTIIEDCSKNWSERTVYGIFPFIGYCCIAPDAAYRTESCPGRFPCWCGSCKQRIPS